MVYTKGLVPINAQLIYVPSWLHLTLELDSWYNKNEGIAYVMHMQGRGCLVEENSTKKALSHNLVSTLPASISGMLLSQSP